MMNKDWANIVKSIIEMKPEKRIFIYTNGTIPPRDEQLNFFQGHKVNFIITDYGKLSKNISKLVEKLDEHNLTYVRTPPENWIDCSSIRHHKRSIKDLTEVFKQCCVKYVYTLLDGKLYRCPFIANADNLNAIPTILQIMLISFQNENTSKKIKLLINNENFFPHVISATEDHMIHQVS